MENKILGEIKNDGKTASWPVEGREAKTIQIWNLKSNLIMKLI